MLLMKKRFFDAIRSGRKTVTVRFWRHARLGGGQVHTIPGLGKVRIERVEPIGPEDLTEELAQSDGFECLCDMKRTLAELYGDRRNTPDGRRLFAVWFSFLKAGRRS
jgi:hypothetical protein